MAERIILHIDMDYFFAQIEERDNPRFRGKPVVVGADPKNGSGRGVVSTANYVARKYGIHSALPISKAYQLCPDAIFLPVNMELYQKVSSEIMEIIKKYSSQWEIISLDEAYLDISFSGSYEKAKEIGENLKKEIFEKEKLTATVGVGPNKIVAKIVSEKAKPNGLLVVTQPEAEKFLEPFDIDDLPGVGPKTAEKMRSLGINKIGDIKKLSKEDLINIFGVVGEDFYLRARGIDENPVSSEGVIKSIGRQYTFEKDTRDSKTLFSAFDEMILDVYKELFEAGFNFKTITVVCRFQGFETHTMAKTLKKPTNDLKILKTESKKLLLKFILQNQKLIRLIGVRVSSFS
ncbi:MAG: DNA polymerase IV [Candidatus Pacebacteria bacterium]|nr:DNA polymerase IV [Candidatus Paceibacterota bacterium]